MMMQLLQDNDIRDRQKIGLFGLKKSTEMVSPKLSDANPITLTRDCAACTGLAPGLMTQIKLACLSYTTSPVTYDDSGAKIEVSDLIRVKDGVLRKAQVFRDRLNRLLYVSKSKYGLIAGDTES